MRSFSGCTKLLPREAHTRRDNGRYSHDMEGTGPSKSTLSFSLGHSIGKLLQLLSRISTPCLDSVCLYARESDGNTLKPKASDGLEVWPTIYQRLMKLELGVFIDETLPRIFGRVNSLIDGSAPVVEHLHLNLYLSIRKSKPGDIAPNPSALALFEW